jgi:hypothetical protein
MACLLSQPDISEAWHEIIIRAGGSGCGIRRNDEDREAKFLCSLRRIDLALVASRGTFGFRVIIEDSVCGKIISVVSSRVENPYGNARSAGRQGAVEFWSTHMPFAPPYAAKSRII